MVDYVYWARVDPLTVEQAARLWANVEPEMPTWVLTSDDKKAVASRLQILKRAIIEGTLQARSHTDDQASVGDHRSCLVQRVDLTAFALSCSEKPNFLFAPGAPSSALLSVLERHITDGSPLLRRSIEDALQRQRERTDNANQAQAGEVDDEGQRALGAEPPGEQPSAEALPLELDDAKTQGVPLQFLMWAVKEKAARGVVLQLRAVEAMKELHELQPKPGRDTVIGWVRKLPENWRAMPGTSEAVTSRKSNQSTGRK
jgi:hypothetical protein